LLSGDAKEFVKDAGETNVAVAIPVEVINVRIAVRHYVQARRRNRPAFNQDGVGSLRARPARRAAQLIVKNDSVDDIRRFREKPLTKSVYTLPHVHAGFIVHA